LAALWASRQGKKADDKGLEAYLGLCLGERGQRELRLGLGGLMLGLEGPKIYQTPAKIKFML